METLSTFLMVLPLSNLISEALLLQSSFVKDFCVVLLGMSMLYK